MFKEYHYTLFLVLSKKQKISFVAECLLKNDDNKIIISEYLGRYFDFFSVKKENFNQFIMYSLFTDDDYQINVFCIDDIIHINAQRKKDIAYISKIMIEQGDLLTKIKFSKKGDVCHMRHTSSFINLNYNGYENPICYS
jgi:hypothetical protein